MKHIHAWKNNSMQNWVKDFLVLGFSLYPLKTLLSFKHATHCFNVLFSFVVESSFLLRFAKLFFVCCGVFLLLWTKKIISYTVLDCYFFLGFVLFDILYGDQYLSTAIRNNVQYYI